MASSIPAAQGLYSPSFEKDACGVGIVCDVTGKRSNCTVLMGIEALIRLSHRGAVGADPETGDGAGILIQTPHEFFEAEAKRTGTALPPPGEYGTGMVFLPRDKKTRDFFMGVLQQIASEEGQTLLGWRNVPVDSGVIGEKARQSLPRIKQPFIGRGPGTENSREFEIKLYVIRRRAEKAAVQSGIPGAENFCITGLSSKTFAYKGLLKASQLPGFFIDLQNESLRSAICMLHARYSTNTFPSWKLAQPFRMLAHNGEINTISGNTVWMDAREKLLSSGLLDGDLQKTLPVTEPGESDSACLDRAFELLCLAGTEPEHAAMMLMPEAWEKNESMDPRLRSFYEFHACMIEPWDGPAAVAFTDGEKAGAILDRNGLRPARYITTKDNYLIMASEAGVLDIPPEKILSSGRLEPGKMLLVDTTKKAIFYDASIKLEAATKNPYHNWLENNLIEIGKTETGGKSNPLPKEDIFRLMNAFGYTREDIRIILKPMAETASEPIGSMGNDIPPAVLSKMPQLLYSYFKQRFAQVTNPPIDPIREKSVMSTAAYTGPSGNLLEHSPAHAGKIKTPRPVLTDGELECLKTGGEKGLNHKTVSLLFDTGSSKSFENALEDICLEAENAAADGCGLIILSDLGVDEKRAAVPCLLAAGAVHIRLLDKGLRGNSGIVLQAGDAREIHHFALLLGCGADLINPYMAFRALNWMKENGDLDVPIVKAIQNYMEAVDKGLLKVLSRMGISSVQSYKGAGIFEILGLCDQIVNRFFRGIPSRIGGIGLEEIAKDTISRHRLAYSAAEDNLLPAGGIYSWRKDGEIHLWNPESIRSLQQAARGNDYKFYKKFSELTDNQHSSPSALRSLLGFKSTTPIDPAQTEPAASIIKRFAAGAMSMGSISREAHETIALAMNRLGAMSNTGEGGEDPARFHPAPKNKSTRSSVKQVAAGRFGVTTHYLVNADEIQIKISQGAKPGEGGHLPAHKVSRYIAKTRYTTPGVALISPPPHHDIYSIEDLAQLIFDLKNVNPRARISVKLASVAGVGTVAAGAVKAHADKIVVSGGDGGTGAAPLGSIKHAGVPWELGLSETHQTLVLNGLRDRVKLQVDGQIRTGRDVVKAAMLGADEFAFGSSLLVCLGCVMQKHCHLDNCVAGIATQDPLIGGKFCGRSEYIENYLSLLAREARDLISQLGARSLEELIGRTDLLEVDGKMLDERTAKLDFSKILYKADRPVVRYPGNGIKKPEPAVLDKKLMELCAESINTGKRISLETNINNSQRAAGAMLSGSICLKRGEHGLPEDTIRIKFRGTAGQSFGAFLVRGVSFELEGCANDYTGKGLFGGKIIIYPDRNSVNLAEKSVITGNTAFYGATRGEAYIRGAAGERFCVRNSGMHAVCEGLGDHGCEYMTGGTVVVLGETGTNFAAGMSGGAAYIQDKSRSFINKCNTEMVETASVDDEDKPLLLRLIGNHFNHTSSPAAKTVLEDFDKEVHAFLKVMPRGLKKCFKNETAAITEA